MVPKSLLLLIVFLAIFVASLSIEASMGAKVGGWQKIDNPNAPEVVKIAKFAVAAHNKQAKTNLDFVTVVKGETQVVAGTNYRLEISAKDGGAAKPKKYQAVVWSKPWQNFLQLTSFEEIKG